MSDKEIIELVASIEAVKDFTKDFDVIFNFCLLYTSPSPRD